MGGRAGPPHAIWDGNTHVYVHTHRDTDAHERATDTDRDADECTAYADIDRSAFASALGFDEEAYGAEAFYNIAVSPDVSLTLDAQVVNPAIDDVDTATILGARLNIRF